MEQSRTTIKTKERNITINLKGRYKENLVLHTFNEFNAVHKNDVLHTVNNNNNNNNVHLNIEIFFQAQAIAKFIFYCFQLQNQIAVRENLLRV